MRILTTLFILVFTYTLSNAQTVPAKQWDVSFGGSDEDYFRSLQQTTDGGYILGGYSYSGIGGDKSQASQGWTDYWIVKTNANGQKQWDARFGGADLDYLGSLQQTTDGGYILGGYSASKISGDKTQASQGSFDYWIVKTDAHGVKQWDARFGGSKSDYFHSLQQTADGGFILGGYSDSGISGDKSQPSQGLTDYWIVKIDANGVKQWDAGFGGSDYDYLYSLQQTADGGYILGGESRSGISGDKSQASQGYADYWIVKTDAYGVKQWDMRFGGSNSDDLHSVQQTNDGGYILGGSSFSGISGDKTQESRGYKDYWIVKTDAHGAKQWDVRFGGFGYDNLRSLQKTSDGGYILGGYSDAEISGDKTQASQGFSDYWIVKIDANGVKQWDAGFGSIDPDWLYSIQQTTDGGYILGGYSDSEIGGDKSQPSEGEYDYWIVKTVPESACVSPISLFETDITSTSAKLNWEAVAGAEGYKVRYKVSGTSEWTNIQSHNNDKKLHGLNDNTEYKWQVKTICGTTPIVSSDWSDKQTFTTGPLKLEESTGNMIFDVYPNPSLGVFNLELQVEDVNALSGCVEIRNALGQKVLQKNCSLEEGWLHEKINLTEGIDPGIYNVIVQIEGQTYSRIIVVQ